MHRIVRIVVAAIVLVAFSLGATDAGLLLSASSKPAQKRSGSCAMHTVKCCCPKVCKTPPKAKPSCHKAAESAEQLGTAMTTVPAGCVLKAGCGTKEPQVAFLQVLKDFVPEALEHIGLDQSRSVFVSATDRFLLLDSSPQFFHPPRNS